MMMNPMMGMGMNPALMAQMMAQMQQGGMPGMGGGGGAAGEKDPTPRKTRWRDRADDALFGLQAVERERLGVTLGRWISLVGCLNGRDRIRLEEEESEAQPGPQPGL
jgi:hypothetical protein